MIRFFTLLFILIGISSQAQPNFQWATQFSGAGNDLGTAVATDAAGNVYLTGTFQNTVDFDPGVGVYTLAAQSSQDIFISKLDAGGNFVWAKQIGNNGYLIGTAITTDT